MFVQKRCLFDTYVLQKKKLRRKFRDSLTLWWVHWRMRLFYRHGRGAVIIGPNYRQSSMLHMQIPTINISLQHCCYKSLDNVCPFFAACERKITVLVLVGRFYCIVYFFQIRQKTTFTQRYFCVAIRIMMLIYALKCETLICNHTNIASI